jgi:exopolysaccharide production protein ExoZ
VSPSSGRARWKAAPYGLYLVHVPTILLVYHFWRAVAGAGLAWLSAIATALLVAVGFGMLDVRLYRYLKNVMDRLGGSDRWRRVNIYAGVFIFASLISAFVT